MKNIAAQHFWDWFQQYQASYLQLRTLPKQQQAYLQAELDVHLYGCCPYVHADLFYKDDQAWAGMVITSYGDLKRFKRIERLVNKAPVLKGWQFQALYPPMPPDFQLSAMYPDLRIDTDQVYFSPSALRRVEGQYELVLYVPKYTRISEEYQQAMSSVVYNVLGERSAVMDISSVEVFHEQEFRRRDGEELVNVQLLAGHIQCRDHSAFQVVEGGGIVPR